jgi:hypothetical protein
MTWQCGSRPDASGETRRSSDAASTIYRPRGSQAAAAAAFGRHSRNSIAALLSTPPYPHSRTPHGFCHALLKYLMRLHPPRPSHRVASRRVASVPSVSRSTIFIVTRHPIHPSRHPLSTRDFYTCWRRVSVLCTVGSRAGYDESPPCFATRLIRESLVLSER